MQSSNCIIARPDPIDLRGVGKYIGICGQGRSDHPDLADWLADEGIVSISLNPDSVVETWKRLATR